ncbi:hypothetical protein FMN50_10145 [Rhodobacterales bacterium]|nr:hypothetical protein FMN50_10145 [Rhodobacterales bacterium]
MFAAIKGQHASFAKPGAVEIAVQGNGNEVVLVGKALSRLPQATFGETLPLSSQHFAGSESFTVADVPIAENLATFGAGLSFCRDDSLALNLSYEGNIAHDFVRNVVKEGIGFRF